MITEGKVLLFTYDVNLKTFFKALIEGESYDFNECNDEAVLLTDLRDKHIEVLVIDFENVNAIELCKKIRENFTLRYIPIILLVRQEDTIEKIKGIYAGADDYVEKPIQAGELLTRIKANLWRTKRDANPLTKLPGNITILKELDKRIKNNDKFSVAYVDLNKFKEYNDYYGFEWGDRLIKNVASIISNVILELGSPTDFLGHIGGDDFIFVTDWDSAESICKKIIEDFNKTILFFYKEEDLNKGGITVKDREGKISSIPITSISIGVATNRLRFFRHVGEIIQIVTELKNFAKTFSKSIYIIDRRKY